MTTTQLGLITGLILGIAGALGGFGAFVLVVVLGALGFLVGSYLDGTITTSDFSERSPFTAGAGCEHGPAEQRGALTVEPRAVERIAAATAVDVDGVGGAARRVLTIAVGSDDAAHRPQVDAVVDGGSVGLDVRCSIAYPAPVAAVADRLRAHLGERIPALTGLSVRAIGITVVALTDPGAGTAGSGRRNLA